MINPPIFHSRGLRRNRWSRGGARLVTLCTGCVSLGCALLVPLLMLSACQSSAPSPKGNAELIALGERIFFNETFAGNGRTCSTCHRAEDNFSLSPDFIVTLSDDDPLFVAEFNSRLAENFESPQQMHAKALIRENQDGFDDLANNFNLRGIPHLLALRTSVQSADGPRTGWSGDGAPGDNSLRAFAVGAIIQHFTKSNDRVVGVDFRLPTDLELDALQAYMLSLGRQRDLLLPLALKGILPVEGQRIFLDNNLGKCNICHFNAGANANPAVFGEGSGNRNFDTGVEGLEGNITPPDDGFGIPGDGTFNTPPLVEAADTAPYFHNNAVDTLEASIEFYNTDAFNNSSSGQMLRALTGQRLNLSDTEIVAVAAFLRAINALENIRSATVLLEEASGVANMEGGGWEGLLSRANHEVEDAFQVLDRVELHPLARTHLSRAMRLIDDAVASDDSLRVMDLAREAVVEVEIARADLVDTAGR